MRADGEGEVGDGDRETVPISLEDILVFAIGAVLLPWGLQNDLVLFLKKTVLVIFQLPAHALTRCMFLQCTTIVMRSLNTNSSLVLLVLLASEKCKTRIQFN